MPTIFYIVIGLIAFLFYMFFRNYWVYGQQIKWNKLVYNYQMRLINNGDDDAFNKYYSYSDLLGAVSSYDKMFVMFWRWQPSAFVEDRDKFNLVMDGIEKINSKTKEKRGG